MQADQCAVRQGRQGQLHGARAPHANCYFLAPQALHFLPLQALPVVPHRAQYPELAQPASAPAVITAAARVLDSSVAREFVAIFLGV